MGVYSPFFEVFLRVFATQWVVLYDCSETDFVGTSSRVIQVEPSMSKILYLTLTICKYLLILFTIIAFAHGYARIIVIYFIPLPCPVLW